MKSELAQRLDVLSIDGIKINQNSLVIADDATDSSIKKVGGFLSSVEKASNWWLGDYCIALQKRKGASYGSKEICEILGLRVGEGNFAEQAAGTSRYYPPESRRIDVSWSHYYEAKQLKDLDQSCKLLKRAQENGWSVSDLRKAVRLQKATAPELSGARLSDDGEVVQESSGSIRDPGPSRIGLSDLYAADRWAAEQLEEGFDPDQDEIKTLLDRTKNLRKLLKQLEDSEAIDV